MVIYSIIATIAVLVALLGRYGSAVIILLAALILGTSSCAPMGQVTPGSHRSAPEAILAPPTRSFTVIDSRPVPGSSPDSVPYSTTRIRRISIR